MERVSKTLFKNGHYLGRPADFDDEIVNRRIRLVKQIDDFCGKDFTLIDIGCGNGASSLRLAHAMKQVLSIDIEESHRTTFNHYKELNKIHNCDFMQMNLENEKLDKNFDRLISFEVIEHLQNEKNVSFYNNILKPGGIAAISVPNKWWIFETHGAKLPLLPWNRVPFFSWLPKPIHEKFSNARIYTKRRIKKLLESAGFTIEKMEYITAPLDVLKDGKLKSFLMKNIFKHDTSRNPFLSTSIFIIARKDNNQ